VGSTAVLVVLVVTVIGGYIGWRLRHAYGVNSDIKVYKARLPAFRKARNRSALTSAFLVVVVLFLLRALLK
jgi:uncharacterized membrane protein YqgA involved in biofilm formation